MFSWRHCCDGSRKDLSAPKIKADVYALLSIVELCIALQLFNTSHLSMCIILLIKEDWTLEWILLRDFCKLETRRNIEMW